MDNIQHLLQMNIDTLVRAELYREMGDFEQAIQILNSLEVADNMKSIHSQLLQQAQQHNRKVFVIYGEIQRNALTLDKYREETYTPSKYDEEDSCHLPF
jgi:hypothetical protein